MEGIYEPTKEETGRTVLIKIGELGTGHIPTKDVIGAMIKYMGANNRIEYMSSYGKGKFRTVLKTERFARKLLEVGEEDIDGTRWVFSPPLPPLQTVRLLNVPFGFTDETLINSLSKHIHGVKNITRGFHREYPSIQNGMRFVKFEYEYPGLPLSIRIRGIKLDIRRPGEPNKISQCFQCKATDHLISECPLKKSCGRCGQSGHDTFDCTVTDESLGKQYVGSPVEVSQINNNVTNDLEDIYKDIDNICNQTQTSPKISYSDAIKTPPKEDQLAITQTNSTPMTDKQAPPSKRQRNEVQESSFLNISVAELIKAAETKRRRKSAKGSKIQTNHK